MTVYAFFMTLLVGMFIGSYLTVAISLKLGAKRSREQAMEMHPSSVEETADEVIHLFNQ